jgi:hypothetical protein
VVVLQPNHRRARRVITLTLTNTSNNAIAIAPSGSTDGFTVSNGSQVVWRSASRKSPIRATQNLAAGQKITFTIIWNGSPNQRHAKALKAGSYTVHASVGGYSASGTIQV